MNTLSKLFLLMLFALLFSKAHAQETSVAEKRIQQLETKKTEVTQLEKKALKKKIVRINESLRRNEIGREEAEVLKKEAAELHARNIENKIAILDNQIALIQRNGELDLNDNPRRAVMGIGTEDEDSNRIFGISFNSGHQRVLRYDRRTYSDLVLAIGFNNAIIEGQGLDDSPYKVGGSRFFELGWAWRTRVFKNTNFMRFNYGFSFQFNGLKPDDNQYFVENGDQTELQEFEFNLEKSKLRMDNLVFPVHLEFGPSRVNRTEDRIRYSLHRQFRLGIGGYGGFNIGTRQKLKYNRDGNRVKDKFKRGYNTSNLIYGLSAYVGVEGILLYAKYDLNPIFKDAPIKQRNISLGLRFDL